MTNYLSTKYTTKTFSDGTGEILAASERGTFTIIIWTAGGKDIVARVRKTSNANGAIPLNSTAGGSTASLAWDSGALTVASTNSVVRYCTIAQV
jgi:hypothetical protein